MGEINETLGIGKKYKIDGQEYEVLPATLEEIELVIEAFSKTNPHVTYNFMAGDDGEKKEALYQVLEVAFGGKVERDKLKKLRRNEVKEIVNFFLVD